MTLSNLRGLHDPVRTEREAVLEAALAELRHCLTWALAEIDGRTHYRDPWQREACRKRADTALSPTSNGGA